MSFDLGSFGSLSSFPIPTEPRAQAYVPPYPPAGAPPSLSSLSPSASFAMLDDPPAGLGMAFSADDLLDPAAFEPEPASGSDGYASATSMAEPPAPTTMPGSPPPMQYASWPTSTSTLPVAMPTAASVFGSASPASSLGTMSPPTSRSMASPPRHRPLDQSPSGAMRSPKRHPIALGHPASPYHYGPLVYPPPPAGHGEYTMNRRDITPRSSAGASAGMMRAQTHPLSPLTGRRRTTSAMSRRDDPTAATAVLPGSPQQRARTASRPTMPVAAQRTPGPIPLSEAMVALEVLDRFIKEREMCEQAGCVNCTAGGAIADPQHIAAVAELGDRVRQRIAGTATTSTRGA